MVTDPESVSPANTGLSHLTSETPFDPMLADLLSQETAIIRISMEQTCQPLAAKPPRMRGVARGLIEMKRLRVKFIGKFADFGGGHRIGAEVDHLPHGKILKMQEFGHG